MMQMAGYSLHFPHWQSLWQQYTVTLDISEAANNKMYKKTNDNMATYVPWIYLHNSEIFDQFLQSSARNVQCPWWLITISRIMSKCIKGQIFGNTSVTIIFGWKQNLICFLKIFVWAQAIRKRFGLFWALNAWLSLSWELESFAGALDLVLQDKVSGWE